MICAEKRGWVCRENAFFILEIFRATHRAGLGGGYIPRRCATALQRTRTAYTSQAAAQAVPDARQTTHKARHTSPDAGHGVPVCTRYRTDRTCCGCWRAGSVSGKVYNFGRLFLSIFIWIYFAESIDNPYIYGYNIISPDKYGLQPQYTKTGGQKP